MQRRCLRFGVEEVELMAMIGLGLVHAGAFIWRVVEDI